MINTMNQMFGNDFEMKKIEKNKGTSGLYAVPKKHLRGIG